MPFGAIPTAKAAKPNDTAPGDAIIDEVRATQAAEDADTEKQFEPDAFPMMLVGPWKVFEGYTTDDGERVTAREGRSFVGCAVYGTGAFESFECADALTLRQAVGKLLQSQACFSDALEDGDVDRLVGGLEGCSTVSAAQSGGQKFTALEPSQLDSTVGALRQTGRVRRVKVQLQADHPEHVASYYFPETYYSYTGTISADGYGSFYEAWHDKEAGIRMRDVGVEKSTWEDEHKGPAKSGCCQIV